MKKIDWIKRFESETKLRVFSIGTTPLKMIIDTSAGIVSFIRVTDSLYSKCHIDIACNSVLSQAGVKACLENFDLLSLMDRFIGRSWQDEFRSIKPLLSHTKDAAAMFVMQKYIKKCDEYIQFVSGIAEMISGESLCQKLGNDDPDTTLCTQCEECTTTNWPCEKYEMWLIASAGHQNDQIAELIYKCDVLTRAVKHLQSMPHKAEVALIFDTEDFEIYTKAIAESEIDEGKGGKCDE